MTFKVSGDLLSAGIITNKKTGLSIAFDHDVQHRVDLHRSLIR